ncbi:succinate CoA transferase [Roseomonas sp. E05]|uniref:succinate CoA transferase n=1 Tax=Roseomonas sp. E05 TaxID=3046310 RepID=UPI0024BB6BA0|nr:succinate CoA transferase [Roseomonas sp. E05]MDJ0389424.1 succinate CoA transferase [Roseomonas sp. E05]
MRPESLRHDSLASRLMSAEEAAQLIRPGAVVGLSGFTRAGDAKAVPAALARRAEKEELRLTLATGASLGHGTDGALARSGALARRYPFQVDPEMRRAINAGEILYLDHHLSETADLIRAGHLRPPEVAIIEAVAVHGHGIVPTTSVGNSAAFLQHASSVIVELNAAQSPALEGVHDIATPAAWGARLPIGILEPADRIGLPYLPLDPRNIVAIVPTDLPDSPATVEAPDATTGAIAGHLLEFLAREVRQGRLTEALAPLQAGIGSVANAVLSGFAQGPFTQLTMFSEVLQDSTFDLMDAGRLLFASASSITLGQRQDVLRDFGRYRSRVVLRPQEITNAAEVLRRLGVLALNSALEVDIYGNVNSTHVNGSAMLNGIGGSGDFARNARLSVFVTPSTAKGGALSCIVPMASHVDHGAQDLDVLVTEQGLADLRGLAPRERAEVIIANCMHPAFRPLARDYFRAACRRGGHAPHLLEEALSWHLRAQRTGSMLPPAQRLAG